MSGIDMLDTGDAWAVGDEYGHDGYLHPLVGHWNGSTWEVAVEPPGTGVLTDVAATSTDDVWAVGHLKSGQVSSQIAHWDGQSWTQYGNAPDDAAMQAVSAYAADDIWTVGYVGQLGVVEHWDGNRWHVVNGDVDGEPLPALTDVAAAGPDDVWAMQSLWPFQLFHWDGSTWSHVTIPVPAAGDAYRFQAISMRSTADGWLVGSLEVNRRPVPVVFHWDGVRWHRIQAKWLPEKGTFTAVTALASGDAWLAGTARHHGLTQIVVGHWNGSRLEPVGGPQLRPSDVWGIDAVADDDVWMTGSTYNPGNGFFAHWDGSTWTAIPQ